MKRIAIVLVVIIILGGMIMIAEAAQKCRRLYGIEGTEIYVDGELIGEIPASGIYDLILEQPVELSFKKEGYLPFTAPPGVTELTYANSCSEYRIPLRRDHLLLIIRGPPGSEIYIDETKIGEINESGEYRLPIKEKINLSFRLEGYQPNIVPQQFFEGLPDYIGQEIIYNLYFRPLPTPDQAEQKIAELENETAALQNTTAEQEQRLSWLEQQMQKIIAFLKTLGFKE